METERKDPQKNTETKIKVIVSLVVLISPIILSQILRIPGGKITIGDENSWVGFFGSYLGSLISGIVTYYVFWETVKYYRKKDDFDSKHQQELKELSIKPFIIARQLKEDRQEGSEHIFNVDIINMETEIIDELELKGEVQFYKGLFEIESVGLGPAIQIDFVNPETQTGGSDIDVICLSVGQKQMVSLRMKSKKDDRKTVCEVRYSDLIGNRYSQIIQFIVLDRNLRVVFTRNPTKVN